MIFDLITTQNKHVILKPIHTSPIDAYDLVRMLENSFPYNGMTFHLGFWDFQLVCYDGYDNAVLFPNPSCPIIH